MNGKHDQLARKVILEWWVMLVMVCVISAPAADIHSYAVYKGMSFLQLYGVDVVPSPSGNGAYVFQAQVRGQNLTMATVATPRQTFTLMPAGLGASYFAQDGLVLNWIADSSDAVESGIGSGACTLSIQSSVNGVQSDVLELGPGPFPSSIPQVNQFPGYQYFTGEGFQWTVPVPYFPTNDLTLTWNSFADGGPEDYIQIAIARSDPDGVRTVFLSPEPGQPGAIPATATHYTIPAGSLAEDNRRFTTTLRFIKMNQLNSGVIPGATGVAGFFAETTFYMKSGDSWYGEPFPDRRSPVISWALPGPQELIERNRPTLHIRFSEPIVSEPILSLSSGMTVIHQEWTSWERLELRCFLSEPYPYDTEITWTIQNVEDMVGNPLSPVEATGTFRTPIAPAMGFYGPYTTVAGMGEYSLAATNIQTVVIECSTNLIAWIPYSTNQVMGGKVQIEVDTRSGQRLFFRARE